MSGEGEPKDKLGERMKGVYEAATRLVLPRRTYTIMRLDGRAFHTYTRRCERPYDLALMGHMDEVAQALCQEASGAALAYVQSDEISLVLCDFATERTQPWFGGVVQKMVSVASSLASAELNRLRYAEHGALGLFDCRAFAVDDRDEVLSYLTWRQRDCERNSVSMMAQSHLSAKALHKMSTRACKAALVSAGDPWDAAPAGFRHGRLVQRHSAVETITYTDRRTGSDVVTEAERSRWLSAPAPSPIADSAEMAYALPRRAQL